MFKVSVIIPNYNHAPYLKQRIDSVLNQTFQDFELIILDDCSTDNSKEVIEQYRDNPKVSAIVFNENNSGSTFRQWKKGLELAKGEYVWIAESDDYCKSNFLEVAFSSLNNNTNALVFFCQSYCVNEKCEVTGDLHFWTDVITKFDWSNSFTVSGDLFVKEALYNRNVISNASAVLFRKEIAKKYIFSVVDYKMCGDWLFWGLIISEGFVIYNSSKMNFFRSHSYTTRLLNNYEKQTNFTLEQIRVVTKLMETQKKEVKVIISSLWYDLIGKTSLLTYATLLKLIRLQGLDTKSFFFLRFLRIKLRIFINSISLGISRK